MLPGIKVMKSFGFKVYSVKLMDALKFPSTHKAKIPAFNRQCRFLRHNPGANLIVVSLRSSVILLMIEHKSSKSAVDSLLNLKIDQLILESDLFRLCFLIPFMQAFQFEG